MPRLSLLPRLLVATVVAGCGHQAAGPALRYVDIGVDETSHPASLAVMVENPGGAPAQLVTASANVSWKYLITEKDATDAIPAEFDYELRPATPDIQVAGHARKAVVLDFLWHVGLDPPPMLAIVHATLQLTFAGGESIETIPVTFIVRSRPDVAIDSMPEAVAPELAAKLQSLPGWKSPGVNALLSALN